MNNEVILPLKDIVELYKKGDKDACECLLEMFAPLIKKHSKSIEYFYANGEDMESLFQIQTLEALLEFKDINHS